MVERRTEREDHERDRESQRLEQSQVDAAWAGVHQARRAVTVAVLAALVAVISAVANLVVPYIQAHIEEGKESKQSHDAKVLLLPGMSAILNMALTAHTQEEAPVPTNDKERAAAIENLKQIADVYDKAIEHQDTMLSQLPHDVTVIQATGLMDAAVLDVRNGVLEQRSKILDAMQASHSLRDQLEQVARDSILKPLSPIYSLEVLFNENGGAHPSPGPLVYVDCDTPKYQKHCHDRQAEDEYNATPMSPDERKELNARIQANRKRAAYYERQPVTSAADYFDPSHSYH